jgi:hypothetical protein|tara:strand:+ start:271 stop:525 length:255 start_codon:yes stop_codon:yes gene_type:complete
MLMVAEQQQMAVTTIARTEVGIATEAALQERRYFGRSQNQIIIQTVQRPRQLVSLLSAEDNADTVPIWIEIMMASVANRNQLVV